jgi:hypothetical protein
MDLGDPRRRPRLIVEGSLAGSSVGMTLNASESVVSSESDPELWT